MNYVPIVVATDLEVPFSVLKKGVSQYFCLYSAYKSLVFGDEFLAQGQTCSLEGGDPILLAI